MFYFLKEEREKAREEMILVDHSMRIYRAVIMGFDLIRFGSVRLLSLKKIT
ncbi:MAG: hypothetical protein ACI8RD_000223 [Bacillariaceae sp.]|jgi:hypothetical protein